VIEATIAPGATPSMATGRVDFYTIERSYTGAPLGVGGPRNKRQVLVALRPMRREVRRKEWQVVGWVRDRWYGDGGFVEIYRISFRVDAQEFYYVHTYILPPGVVT
jgi:hypothetical protein